MVTRAICVLAALLGTALAANPQTLAEGKALADAGACAACHSPPDGPAFSGGTIQGWTAFNITPDPISGIGTWSTSDIVTYLATGELAGRAQAAGSMADVISNSTRLLSPSELRALAIYLQAQTPIRALGAIHSRNSFGAPDPDLLSFSDPKSDPNRPGGRALYVAACASCHALRGTGVPGYPSLVGNSELGAASADNLALTILDGVQRTGTSGTVFMPPFGPDSAITDTLTDDQIATLANYLMRQFGNPAAARLTAVHVTELRKTSSSP